MPDLAYGYDALEPVIDRATMQLHHDKHHKAYVDDLNAALGRYPSFKQQSIEDLLRSLDKVPDAIRTKVRNYGGGHANHQLFWKVMTPRGSAVPENLRQQITADFGSMDAMKTKFEEAGTSHFGSGWAFLVMNPEQNKLEILTLPNQDSVLMQGKPALLGNDLWEHAYYLKYQNKRADYLKAWWNVVNWAYVGERLQGIRDGRPQL